MWLCRFALRYEITYNEQQQPTFALFGLACAAGEKGQMAGLLHVIVFFSISFHQFLIVFLSGRSCCIRIYQVYLAVSCCILLYQNLSGLSCCILLYQNLSDLS